MSQAFQTRCPHCDAVLKLKDRSAVGTKKRCPSCRKTFTVKSASSKNSAKPSRASEGDDFDDEPVSTNVRLPSSTRRKTPVRQKKSARAKPTPIVWGVIAGGVLILAIIVGLSLFRRHNNSSEQTADGVELPAGKSAAVAEPVSDAKSSPAMVAENNNKNSSPGAKEIDTTVPATSAKQASPADSVAAGSSQPPVAPAKSDEPATSEQKNEETNVAETTDTTSDDEPDGRGRSADESPVTLPPDLPMPKDGKEKPLITDAPKFIKIDGKFEDWAGVTSYTDPEGDTHDVDHHEYNKPPQTSDHADTDLLEYKVAHDAENLYLYFRARGQIGRTQKPAKDKPGGRYYVICTIDVDQNDKTGYWLHEGGYWPTSPGYDVNAEVEYYGGKFNTGHYLNHGCRTKEELGQAFLEQSTDKYREKRDGPYRPGFMRLAAGSYKYYTQWVYHSNNTITFVRDKGPIVRGIVQSAISKDEHEIEVIVPYKGFLKSKDNKPIVALGQTLDLSFSLESSSELVKDKIWTSDTGEPIERYVLTGSADSGPKKSVAGAGQ